jgi:threonine synthase
VNIAYEGSRLLIEDEIPADVLLNIVEDAFDFEVPVRKIAEDKYVMELFHGPTLAFKDFGARFMARVMGYFLQKDHSEVNILVATSGDTGSAVAQGFLGVSGVKVTLLYPKGKVSKIQEQQLTTIGQNITALEVDGTFDDCQRLVKAAFLDKELNANMNLSSANSINIARLIPQSFYYAYAVSRLMDQGKDIVFSVPSGNFGNLCGGLLAQKMGIPIMRFIAATNVNDIVPEYLRSGDFIPRSSVQTIANAMDVGNPSNFARLTDLYHGDYSEIARQIQGISFTDSQTRSIINEVFERYNYLMCPHTAIGFGGLMELLQSHETGICLSTAHPCKFHDVVEPLIGQAVEIPHRLSAIIDRKKHAISMTTSFNDFKDFLFNR